MIANYKKPITLQQGIPRALQGPLAGCGVSPLTFPNPAAEGGARERGLE